MAREKSLYTPIFILNGFILTIVFIITAILTGTIYVRLNLLLDTEFLSLGILMVCFLIFYLLFILFLALYYRLLLLMIPEKETTFYLHEEGKARTRQILRFILSGLAIDIAVPLLYYAPGTIRLFGGKIGKNFVMRARIINPELIEIGDNVLIADGTFITTHLRDGDRVISKRIKIGNNCTIGMRSIIFPGVEIGDNSIVSACSLVPKNTIIPPNEIWAGIPAKKVAEVKTR